MVFAPVALGGICMSDIANGIRFMSASAARPGKMCGTRCLKRGQSFEEIATSENQAKRRILQVIDLAFLAPDIVKSIMRGD